MCWIVQETHSSIKHAIGPVDNYLCPRKSEREREREELDRYRDSPGTSCSDAGGTLVNPESRKCINKLSPRVTPVDLSSRFSPSSPPASWPVNRPSILFFPCVRASCRATKPRSEIFASRFILDRDANFPPNPPRNSLLSVSSRSSNLARPLNVGTP